MIPGLLDTFNVGYEKFSQASVESYVPPHFNAYKPLTSPGRDFSCLVVIQPAPEKGAKEWLHNGKRALLGVYRDEGRSSSRLPQVSCSYAYQAGYVTCSFSEKHYLRVGDVIELYGVAPTVITVTALTISSPTSFIARIPLTGASSGTCISWPTRILSFFEERVVYRFLPSMQLVAIADVNRYFEVTSPRPTTRVSYKPTGAKIVTSGFTMRGNNGYQGSQLVINRQQFGPGVRSLQQSYSAAGAPVRAQFRARETANAARLLTTELGSSLLVFDYYGYPLNDPSRGPYFSDRLISADERGNLVRQKTTTGSVIYSGFVFDQFGLHVTGAAAGALSHQLYLRDPVLPVEVDNFNVPLQAPILSA